LDVGCRDCALKVYVADLVKEYRGVDLYQNKDNSVDFVANFKDGLKMPDNTYDCVVALDLVEHLDDFTGGMDELLRIANKDLFVMIPNSAHLLLRLNFLFKAQISNKYNLEYGMGEDRHRWLTILSQTDKYMKDYAAAKKLKLERYYFTDGKKIILEKICRFLRLPPNLYVWSMLYVLKK
jgi:hypothetical protein